MQTKNTCTEIGAYNYRQVFLALELHYRDW